MERTFDALDVKSSRTNGLLQMVNGILCILFNIAIFVFRAVIHNWLGEDQMNGSGIWGGVFYVVSGALLFAAGKPRSPCLVISALVLNVMALIVNLAHVAFMNISVMSDERRLFNNGPENSWRYPVYVSLFRYVLADFILMREYK